MYGLLIGILSIFSILIAEKIIKERKLPISSNEFWNNIIILFLLSIVGGRTYHVLDNYNLYIQNPFSILYIWNGGFGIFGSIVFIFLYFLLYSKIKRTSFYMYLDLICLVSPIIQIAGRIGNIINKELLFSALEIPVFAYLLISNYYNRNKLKIGQGKICANYFIFYGLIRIAVEPYRNKNNSYIINGINLTYTSSLFLILIGFGIIVRIKFKLTHLSKS